MLSIAVASFYIFSTVVQILYCFTNACYFLFFLFFDSRHPKRYEVISDCCFDLHFSDS